MSSFFLLLTLVLSPAGRCPDLSGKYLIQGEDGQVHLTITQDECLQITIERSSEQQGKKAKEKHTLPLDGTFHSDSDWLGGSSEKVKSAAKFVDGKLELSLASASSGEVFSKETWQLLPDKSLEIKDLNGGTKIARKTRR